MLLGRFFDPAIDCVLAGGGDVIGFAGDSCSRSSRVSIPRPRNGSRERRPRCSRRRMRSRTWRPSSDGSTCGARRDRSRCGDARGRGERAGTTGGGGREWSRRRRGLRRAMPASGGRTRRAAGGSGRAPARPAVHARGDGRRRAPRYVPRPSRVGIHAGAARVSSTSSGAVTTIFIGLAPGTGIDDVLDVVPSVLDARRALRRDDDRHRLHRQGRRVAPHVRRTRRQTPRIRLGRWRASQELDRNGPRLSCGSGVATGRCFSGIVGSPARRRTRCCGDSVNLAARLMQVAEREARSWADAATRTGTGDIYSWDRARRPAAEGQGNPRGRGEGRRARDRRPLPSGNPSISASSGGTRSWRSCARAVVGPARAGPDGGGRRARRASGSRGSRWSSSSRPAPDGVSVATDGFELARAGARTRRCAALWTARARPPGGRRRRRSRHARCRSLDHDAAELAPVLAAVLGLRRRPDERARIGVEAESE